MRGADPTTLADMWTRLSAPEPGEGSYVPVIRKGKEREKVDNALVDCNSITGITSSNLGEIRHESYNKRAGDYPSVY